MLEIFYYRNPLVHLNIKSKNILLDKAYNARLTGFDVSRSLGKASRLQSSLTTERDAYRDPANKTNFISKDIDLYALGVGMYQACFYKIFLKKYSHTIIA